MDINALLTGLRRPGENASAQQNQGEKRTPVRQAKLNLNRLGLYHPKEGGGMDDTPDPAFITALKTFQRRAGILADGNLGDSLTLRVLKREVAQRNGDLLPGWYI